MKTENRLIISEVLILCGMAFITGGFISFLYPGYGLMATSVFLIGGGITLMVDNKMFRRIN